MNVRVKVREKFRELAGEVLEPMLPTGEDAVELYLDSIRDDDVRKLIRSKLSSIHCRYSEKSAWVSSGHVRPAPKRRKVEVVTVWAKERNMKKRRVIKVQLKTIETGCFLEITFDTGIVDP